MTDSDSPRLTPSARQRSPRSYEVHIEGELGSALLGYLHWSNRTLPEQSVLRLELSPADLHRFLNSCAECGLAVERITRIDPVADQGPMNPSTNLATQS